MVIDASINDTMKATESTFRDMAIHDGGAGLDEEELRFRRLSLLSIAMLLLRQWAHFTMLNSQRVGPQPLLVWIIQNYSA